MSDVKRLARWTGWCDPCETERPLVLTEAGERGLRAWLRGVGHEDRSLKLTCCCCGEWQEVPPAEDDLPEATTALIVALHPVGTRQVAVRAPARSVSPAYPDVPVPAARVAVNDTRTTLHLVTEGYDLIAMAS
jgi:hypothetical protein